MMPFNREEKIRKLETMLNSISIRLLKLISFSILMLDKYSISFHWLECITYVGVVTKFEIDILMQRVKCDITCNCNPYVHFVVKLIYSKWKHLTSN